jgi:hypothetical protein
MATEINILIESPLEKFYEGTFVDDFVKSRFFNFLLGEESARYFGSGRRCLWKS